ncbi:MAG: ATP-binding protein [Paludibacter sp.]|nr:ATP-binding protein [Paludibacter sp.]
MIRKEVLKELIVTFQESIPTNLFTRNVVLPIDTEKIIALRGVRRCGKSSILQLSINQLIESGILKEQILFLNFDDERLQFDLADFDLIIQSYQELFPHIRFQDVYVFFDEVQTNTGWEQFVRRVYDQQSKHVFITGSNSKMLSSEIATSLRGRTLQYEILPLSFAEFCNFEGLDKNVYSTTAKPKLKAAFTEYLHFGGFPEVVLMQHEHYDRILQEYYFVMLYKDLVERYKLKNISAIKYFINRMLVNITKPTSINKIFNELKSLGVNVSKNTLYELAEYLEAIYFFIPVQKYEPSLVKQTSSDKKYYCIDNGLRKSLSQTLQEDNGLLLENAVYLWLRSQCDMSKDIYYYKGTKECDFVVTQGTVVERLIQVCWDMSEKSTYDREIAGLLEASNKLNCMNLTIITSDFEQIIEVNHLKVNVVPAWKLMLL